MVKWKIDFTSGKADAEKVYNELQTIAERTPENIVEYARNESTELHKCFEWDDSIAAENWRKCQARALMCQLVYEPPKEAEPVKIRVFQQSSEQKYEPVKVFLQDKDEYAKLLLRAKAELQAFKQRYKTLTELSEIFALIDEI